MSGLSRIHRDTETHKKNMLKEWILNSRTLKPLLRLVLPHPLASPTMEFKYGLWAGISSLFGEDDRQLGENNTRPARCRRNVKMEFQSCKYQGSRYGKQINVSALRTAMNHFYGATAITVAIRDYHMSRIGKSSTDQPGAWDLYAISRASLALISYHYRSQNISPTERLNEDLASQFKLVTGIFMIVRDMVLHASAHVQRNEPVSAKVLYNFADENQIFRSPTDMVCAGSENKITEFLEFANWGRSHPNAKKLNTQSKEDLLNLLRSFAPDLDAWYSYALSTIELDYFIQMQIFRNMEEFSCPKSSTLVNVAKTYQKQHEYWLDLMGKPDMPASSNFRESVLWRQNKILRLLGKAPIDRISEKLITKRLERGYTTLRTKPSISLLI